MNILLLLIWGLFSQGENDGRGALIVRISNLESADGCIRLALHERENFLDEKRAVITRVIRPLPAEKQELTVELQELEFKEYAVAIFHDINDNGKLDTNLLGIPTEPYAFSNNPGVKWRSPNYEEARFEFSKDRQVIEVTMQRWRER